MRQDDLGVTRGEKAGQCGGGSRERGQDQSSEGLGYVGARYSPAQLPALETQKRPQHLCPQGAGTLEQPQIFLLV